MTWAVKAAGALCILAASAMVGIELERGMKKRWMFLLEMQEVLAFLEKEMTYHRSPIPEAFRGAASRCSTELKGILLLAAGEAEKREGRSFEEIWSAAVDESIPAQLLSAEELQAVKGAADALCNPDVVMQRTLLEQYAGRFGAMSKKAAEVCREKGGLYRKLTTAAGIFLVILFI